MERNNGKFQLRSWPMGVAASFSYGGRKLAPSRVAQVNVRTGGRYSALSKGCVLLHIHDKEGNRRKKLLSYTHLFKKEAASQYSQQESARIQ